MPDSTKPRPPLSRFFSYTPAKNGLASLLTLQVGKNLCSYTVRQIDNECDSRLAFEVGKLDLADPQTYHVRLMPDGSERECDCMGFLRWADQNGQHCKHVDAVALLLTEGLPLRPESQTPAVAVPLPWMRMTDQAA
ncbi:MAG TPA: hypothetical protein VGZ47_07825 [Gemmataceae bacterium]|jgi:hypothetical protein|nr:hypothetical protein [Gemmataceae bacterium]